MHFITFEPIYQERVWGGQRIGRFPARALPAGRTIGESWEIVDRCEVQSLVASGPMAGMALRDLLSRCGDDVMGHNYRPECRFPILVKWLDCHRRLSLQVHPPKEVAASLGGESKTENWYVADALPGASVLVGTKPGIARGDFEKQLAEGEVETHIVEMPVRKGDSIFVPSGQVHAIGEGILILEIQENSDTTYRVYDWARVGLDGKRRPLHISESLQSMDFGADAMPLMHTGKGDAVLVDCPEFRLCKLTREPTAQPVTFAAGDQPRLFHVISGSFRENESGKCLEAGANALLPIAGSYSFAAEEEGSEALVTENFIRKSG